MLGDQARSHPRKRSPPGFHPGGQISRPWTVITLPEHEVAIVKEIFVGSPDYDVNFCRSGHEDHTGPEPDDRSVLAGGLQQEAPLVLDKSGDRSVATKKTEEHT